MKIKKLVRSTLNFLHLDLTKNLEYDRLSKKIMKAIVAKNSNCIDIGCHQGEILEEILKLAPNGKHFAFEPIPDLYSILCNVFDSQASIFPFALSDKNGLSTFHFVKNAPAFSGINMRKYNIKHPEIVEIEVQLKMLDELIPRDQKIDFIKIDVEGGEFAVLKGAKELLKKNLPTIIFESGLGASDYYNTAPEDLYNFVVNEIGLKISTLKSYFKNLDGMSEKEFVSYFNKNKEYYFVAHK